MVCWETYLSFRFVYRADPFKRQFLHRNSALKTRVYTGTWKISENGPWAQDPRHVQHSSRDLHSCRGEVQFPGGHDPSHSVDLEQKSKARYCRHRSFPCCCATQKLWDTAKPLLCLPKRQSGQKWDPIKDSCIRLTSLSGSAGIN